MCVCVCVDRNLFNYYYRYGAILHTCETPERNGAEQRPLKLVVVVVEVLLLLLLCVRLLGVYNKTVSSSIHKKRVVLHCVQVRTEFFAVLFSRSFSFFFHFIVIFKSFTFQLLSKNKCDHHGEAAVQVEK